MSNLNSRAYDRYVLNLDESEEQKRWRKAKQLQERYPGALVVPKRDVDHAAATIEQEVQSMLELDEADPLNLFAIVPNEDGTVSIRMPRMVAEMPRNEERDREYAQRILEAYGQDNPFTMRRAMKEYLADEERDGRAFLEAKAPEPETQEA